MARAWQKPFIELEVAECCETGMSPRGLTGTQTSAWLPEGIEEQVREPQGVKAKTSCLAQRRVLPATKRAGPDVGSARC